MFKFLNLQLFADGAAGAGAEGTAENSLEGNNTGEGLQNNPADDNSSAAGNNDGTNNNAPNPDEEFESLIKDKYKDQFNARVQKIINKRIKTEKGVSEKLEGMRPIIDILEQKYGTADAAKLQEAFKNDKSFWEAGAEASGQEVESYKEIMLLKAENERYRRMYEMTEGQRLLKQQLEEWQQAGETVKEEYPDFDLQSEMKNRDFIELLKAHIPMKMAYELVHSNEIKESIRKDTEKKVLDNIRAKGMRVPENGANSSNGFVLGKDVSSMTNEEIDDIARRAVRGEKIVL